MSEKQYDDMGALWENQAQSTGKTYYKGRLRLPDGTEIAVVAFPFTTRSGKVGLSVREDTKAPEQQEQGEG